MHDDDTHTRTHTPWCVDRDHPEDDCVSRCRELAVGGLLYGDTSINTWLIGQPGMTPTAVIDGHVLDTTAITDLIARLLEMRATMTAADTAS